MIWRTTIYSGFSLFLGQITQFKCSTEVLPAPPIFVNCFHKTAPLTHICTHRDDTQYDKTDQRMRRSVLEFTFLTNQS